MKKYQIIYADPPWEYEKELQWPDKSIYPLAHFYPTMKLDDIKAIQVPAEKDSWLILWTTVPKLIEGIEVLAEWGFQYRSSAIWDKGNGLGYFFRIYHEILLIGRRGNPPNPIYSEASVFVAERKAHSQKPECVRNWINKAFPDLAKVEMFARGDRKKDLFGDNRFDGWDVWGNEVESDIELESL